MLFDQVDLREKAEPNNVTDAVFINELPGEKLVNFTKV